MRYGFTTGSCAAAAAKAAAYMLLFGKEKQNIDIITPKGLIFKADIVDIVRSKDMVSCAVIKDGGDDPDVTTGAHIAAAVSLMERQKENKSTEEEGEVRVHIDGGKGVGRITKPGLDQPLGNAAINSVPREMIKKEVTKVCRAADFKGDIKVIISVPEGITLAEKTFNPRLGIEGGISIIGTGGVVEPMSMQALLDTISVELNQHRAMGRKCAAITPGNYGQDYLKKTYGYDIDKSVKCSNFIGKTIDMAVEKGFKAIVLTGNIGKLVKVAGGIMNTHSGEGDCRMELIAAAALQEGVSLNTCRKILDCVMTDEAVRLIDEEGKKAAVMSRLMDKIMFYLRKRAGSGVETECVMYSGKYGELAKSEGADKWLTLLAQDLEQQI